jgi:hypothetical protein
MTCLFVSDQIQRPTSGSREPSPPTTHFLLVKEVLLDNSVLQILGQKLSESFAVEPLPLILKVNLAHLMRAEEEFERNSGTQGGSNEFFGAPPN